MGTPDPPLDLRSTAFPLNLESAFLALARENLAMHFTHGIAAKIAPDGSWIDVGSHADLSDDLGS